ncbi:hypothetical protein B0H19DRAFT_223980 [Mycena capillaripes]|nr:hypothetical protein B0H19DRAFT_223980 [Mycena capillaripes]
MPPIPSYLLNQASPRVVGAPEPFDPAKHPNCRLTELFVQGGFARVTLDEIDRMFDAAGHSRGPTRTALIEAFLRDADATLDASGGRIRYLGLKPEAADGPVGDVFFVDIPGDLLSIRFFPGDSRPEDGMFFLDFYDRGCGLACNAPPVTNSRLSVPEIWRAPFHLSKLCVVWRLQKGLKSLLSWSSQHVPSLGQEEGPSALMSLAGPAIDHLSRSPSEIRICSTLFELECMFLAEKLGALPLWGQELYIYSGWSWSWLQTAMVGYAAASAPA